ncbi:MAG: hypothetical protein Q9217_005694 [Psora testacea]
MFPTFTGRARSKRQVNLSGRNNNPFAAYGGSTSSPLAQPSQTAVVHAQQERIQREQERRRPPAATSIQRTWRGHRSRVHTRNQWEQEWDRREGWNTDHLRKGPYPTAEECLMQLRLLAQFALAKSENDIQRLHHFAARFLPSFRNIMLGPSEDVWAYPMFCLARVMISVLGHRKVSSIPVETVSEFLMLLTTLTKVSKHLLARYSQQYYKSINNAARYCRDEEALRSAVLALLARDSPSALSAYAGFASEILTQASLPGFFEDREALSRHVDYSLVAGALNETLSSSSSHGLLLSKSHEELLWLFSYFIFLRNESRENDRAISEPDPQYVKIVSKLISVLANEIGKRLDNLQTTSIPGVTTPQNASIEASAELSHAKPLPDFVRSQILSLISQENVSGLLAKMEASTTSAERSASTSEEAPALASYALTLLRVFPRRKDEIQMWLYRGSTSVQPNTQRSLPATKYFYRAASSTSIFQKITKDPRETVAMLRPNTPEAAGFANRKINNPDSRDQEWRIILLFLELCTFMLKVMDDEEFLAGSSQPVAGVSWTKQSALPLDQIETLTIFLKNLAFSMYWSASEIAGIEAKEATTSLAAYFGKEGTRHSDGDTEDSARMDEMYVGGASGMTLTSTKGLVTGVLRMFYERDSRRKFLPKDHWLMTQYFEMDRFITFVVEEEEHKHEIEESYGDATEVDTYDMDEADSDIDMPLVGTQRVQQIRTMERLRRQQRKTSRRKYLESVTPRLKILENMPFFIPFHTRVQIFRRFVALDQLRRRGTANPDEWRFALMNSPTGNISKHRATVRREHIFDDAYKSFYDLGDGLKEPIQIRFVDKFDTVEEGIDGGGVTKEFLTSVTNEAFGATNGLEALFVENDQHLLYPNPSAVEERKETLRQALYKEGSPDWNDNIRDLLRRYEFLGRIIGKCLYEGILVDIHFAPFFLLKWALTGGTSSASKETSYRANLNDLRDLDEGLYEGLLQLKNYPGNVEKDFFLNFAVTDTLHLTPTQSKTITRELRPNGESIPVTNENRLVYIASIARHRLQTQPYLQTSAFLRGLGTIISPSWLSMFNQSELQTLIGGSGASISISDLRAHTQYGGVYAIGDDGMEHPSIQLFWKVMENLDAGDLAKVLKFVTSTPRAPLLGFGYLEPRFSIRDSGSDQTRLPSTSTCVNLLKLPIYRDEEVLRERLLYSVNSGAGFNLS